MPGSAQPWLLTSEKNDSAAIAETTVRPPTHVIWLAPSTVPSSDSAHGASGCTTVAKFENCSDVVGKLTQAAFPSFHHKRWSCAELQSTCGLSPHTHDGTIMVSPSCIARVCAGVQPHLSGKPGPYIL